MKLLIKTLILSSALSVLAGVDVAAIEDLPCGQAKCVFHVLLNRSGTEENRGWCQGVHITAYNSEMVCHPVKGMTCTDSAYISGKNAYWSCTCTNWSTTKKQSATIDVLCPLPGDKRK